MVKKIRVTLKNLESIDLNQIENYSITENQWSWISINKKFSEEFIEKFQDKVSWSNISYYQVLSEDFIEKFQDKVDWSGISYFQKLSEDFIEKFQDKVVWYFISRYQELSDKFVNKYRNMLDMEEVNKRRNKRIRKVIENALK